MVVLRASRFLGFAFGRIPYYGWVAGWGEVVGVLVAGSGFRLLVRKVLWGLTG